MSGLIIRELQPEEYPLLKRFLYLAVYVPEGAPPLPVEIIQQAELRVYCEEFGRPGDCAVTAVKQGVPVGAAWARLFTPQAPGYGSVDPSVPELAIAVEAAYRGRGIGTALLQQLLDRLGTAGFSRVSLAVEQVNPAVRLYRRSGFTVHSESGDDFVMCCDLKQRV